MITIDNLKSLLKQQVKLIRQIYPHPDWKYGGFEELVLDCGSEFNQFFTQNIERGILKSCYWNCQQLLKEYPELIYCEGYALAPDVLIPLKHSWLINKQQEIIEPTWDANDSIYLGIPFSTLWFKSVLNSRSAMGRKDEISILEGNYLEEFSLLKKGLPDNAIAKIISIA
ncbi:hypothetical protein [Myxosarcina sp. GI1]|uniref:hypothetical protein n=1 Tax=Myxosarcina sp. GI1 TaxID=1541065 RepID=UPI00155AF254|nr:hypothetical protein [Myxosarcina sp. GI1]